MAYPDNLLSRGERVVLHKHPHWKVLILPVLVFIVIVAGGSFFAAWVNKWQDSGLTTHLWWFVGVGVVGLVLLVFACLVPFMRWRSEHFVLTTGHVFFRTGILNRREHQIPLSRIQNIETVVTFWGRILGYGSLIVDSAADQPLEFSNVASLTKVQSRLNQLVADDREQYVDQMDPRSRSMPRGGEGGYGGEGEYGGEPDRDDRRHQRRRDSAPDEGPTGSYTRAYPTGPVPAAASGENDPASGYAHGESGSDGR